MICMLCDHTANTTGWFLGGFASFRVSVYTICLYASVFKAPPTDFLCSAPEIEASPVNEPEPSSHFLGCVGRQTKQPSRIFFPWLWSGSFRSCSSLLCYWDNKGALISSHGGSLCREGVRWCNAVRAAAPARTYLMRYGREEGLREQCNNNTSAMILWGVIIFIISMITVTATIIRHSLSIYTVYFFIYSLALLNWSLISGFPIIIFFKSVDVSYNQYSRSINQYSQSITQYSQSMSFHFRSLYYEKCIRHLHNLVWCISALQTGEAGF